MIEPSAAIPIGRTGSSIGDPDTLPPHLPGHHLPERERCNGFDAANLRVILRSFCLSISKLGLEDCLGPADFEILERKLAGVFRGQTVIDVGAGMSADGLVAAAAGGAERYIACELFNVHRLSAALERARLDWPQVAIPVEVIAGGAASALRHLPDQQYSIICTGVDAWVVPDNRIRTAITSEIVRLLSGEGALLVGNSGLDFSLLPTSHFEYRDLGDRAEKRVVHPEHDVFTVRRRAESSSAITA